MSVNRALSARRATGLRINRPSGGSERSVKEDDSKETEPCEDRTRAIVMPKSHLRPKLLKLYAKAGLITADWPNRTAIPEGKETVIGGVKS